MKINKTNLSSSYNNINNHSDGNMAPQSFKGAPPKTYSKFDNFFTLSKAGPMSRKLFILNAFAFLLGTRLITSRDKDEVRETMIRDVPTIVIAVMGVPVAEAFIAKKLQEHYEYALVKDAGEKGPISKWIGKTILRKKEISHNVTSASYNELKDWYIYKDLKSGFGGFLDRLDGLNGNLKTICSDISDEAKATLDKNQYSKDNKEFKKKLFDGSTDSNKLLEMLEDGFKDVNNNVLRKAMFRKTITKMFAFAAPLTLVGLCIPKLNIAITEAIHKGENEKNKRKIEKQNK